MQVFGLNVLKIRVTELKICVQNVIKVKNLHHDILQKTCRPCAGRLHSCQVHVLSVGLAHLTVASRPSHDWEKSHAFCHFCSISQAISRILKSAFLNFT